MPKRLPRPFKLSTVAEGSAPAMVPLPRHLVLLALDAMEEHFENTEWVEVLRATTGEKITTPATEAGWRKLAKKYDEQGLMNTIDLITGLRAALLRQA